METELVCPLGAKCEEARDGKVYRCMWYTQVRGTNPNTGEELDEFNCAMSWMPMLLIDNARQSYSTGAAVESFRNEMVKSNDKLLAIARPQMKEIGHE